MALYRATPKLINRIMTGRVPVRAFVVGMGEAGYPDMTREEVADLIDLEDMQGVMTCAMDVSGLKRKVLEAAKWGGDV